MIGISHEGGDDRDERGAGSGGVPPGPGPRSSPSRTARPAREPADIVVETGELDQSWCHTVGYVSPLVAAAAVGGPPRRPARRRRHCGRRCGSSSRPAWTAAAIADAVAARLAGVPLDPRRRVGRGPARPAGSSTLKIEEGTWIPAAYRDLETFLHGHLAATDDVDGARADPDRPGSTARERLGPRRRRPARRTARSAWRPRRSSRPTPRPTCRPT